MTISEIAEALGGRLEGDGEYQIVGVAEMATAGGHEIAFADGKRAAREVIKSAAGCVVVGIDFPDTTDRNLIRVKDPRTSFARLIRLLHPPKATEPSIHPTAILSPSAVVGESVSVGAYSVVGDRTTIGSGTVIGRGCQIGRDVSIGKNGLLYDNITVYHEVDIGDRTILHAGVVIGADGFGFVMVEDRYEKFPQIGRVTIGDDVEIGANSCVDRAALGVTTISDGVKIDNQVHVAHNVTIGKHVVIAAQSGISGGVRIDDYVVIGGKVGIGDKAHIEARAVLGGGCGILTSKVVRSGQIVWGTPARPLREYLGQLAEISRLARHRTELKEIKERLERLEDGG